MAHWIGFRVGSGEQQTTGTGSCISGGQRAALCHPIGERPKLVKSHRGTPAQAPSVSESEPIWIGQSPGEDAQEHAGTRRQPEATKGNPFFFGLSRAGSVLTKFWLTCLASYYLLVKAAGFSYQVDMIWTQKPQKWSRRRSRLQRALFFLSYPGICIFTRH